MTAIEPKASKRRMKTDMTIIVNGKRHTTSGPSLSYSDVLDIGFSAAALEGASPTMTWRTWDGRTGTLTPGQHVNLSAGMVFNVVDTGNA